MNFPVGAGIGPRDLEEDPHPLLARLRETEPVSWLPALGGWLVTRHDLAVRVMRDPATFTVDDPRFSTAQVVGPSMLSLDGPAHARHREPFAHAFRPAAVRGTGSIHPPSPSRGPGLTGFIAAETDRLIAAMATAGGAELRRSFAGPLAVAVVTEALGLPDVDPATVLAWYAAIVEAVSEVSAGHAVPAAGTDAVAELRTSVERAISTPDRPSVLAAAASTLRPPEVVSNAAVLMFGGIDTTEGMITNAVHHLLTHPDVPVAPTDLPAAVEESIRLEPVAARIDRYATRATRLGSADIARGDLVVVSIAAANRDPAVFPDPDRFDPTRPDTRLNLAFAQGPHFCLGAHLARTETITALSALRTRFPHLRLDPAHPTAPRGLIFRKPPALHVLW